MPRTVVAPTQLLGPYPGLPLSAGAAAGAWAAADTVNKNRAELSGSGREVLAVWNTAGASATVTVTSATDVYGRSGDITAYAIPAGEVHFLGQFDGPGWRQSDGYLWFEGSATTVKFAWLRRK
jgi:hypothetical protein